MQTDSIADLIARIKNGYLSRKKSVILPWSKAKENLAKVLLANDYLGEVGMEEKEGKKNLTLQLKYENDVPVVTQIRRVSKPSLRVYVRRNEIKSVLGGMGISVISTPQGLMTNKQARKQGFGGEVWCEVW